MPTMLLVRIVHSARKPLEIGEIMKIPAMVTGNDFHHCNLLSGGSVEVMGGHSWKSTRYMERPIMTGKNVIRITRRKVGDPAEPARMAHLDGESQSVVQSEPDGHLQEHLEAAACGN